MEFAARRSEHGVSQGNIRKKGRKLGTLGNGLGPSQPSTSLEDLKAPEITCLAASLNRDGGMELQSVLDQCGPIQAAKEAQRRQRVMRLAGKA
jgi:hypothetical protein